MCWLRPQCVDRDLDKIKWTMNTFFPSNDILVVFPRTLSKVRFTQIQFLPRHIWLYFISFRFEITNKLVFIFFHRVKSMNSFRQIMRTCCCTLQTQRTHIGLWKMFDKDWIYWKRVSISPNWIHIFITKNPYRHGRNVSHKWLRAYGCHLFL